MDTKLKNISRQWYLKIAAYLLIVVCGVGIMQVFWELVSETHDTNLAMVVEPVYEESDFFRWEIQHYVRDVHNTEGRYESREAIEKGEYINEQDIENQMRSYFQDWVNADGNIRFKVYDNGYYDTEINSVYDEYVYLEDEHVYEREYTDGSRDISIRYGTDGIPEENDSQTETPTRDYRYSSQGEPLAGEDNSQGENIQGKDLSYERFLKGNPELKEALKESWIKQQLRDYDEAKERLKSHSDLFIFEFVNKNSEKQAIGQKISAYEKLPVYGYVSGNGIESNNRWLQSAIMESDIWDNDSGYLFVGVNSAVFAEKSQQWTYRYEKTAECLKKVAGFAVGMLLSVIYLLAVAGRRPKEEGVHFYPIDRIWSEIQLGIGIGAACLEIAILEGLLNWIGNGRDAIRWQIILVTAGTFLTGTVLLLILLSQVKKIKDEKFLEGFITLRLIMKWFRGGKAVLRDIWRRGKLFHRLLLLAVVLPLLCATWIGIPFVIVLVIFMIQRHIGDFDQICKGAELIRSGKLDHEIVVKGGEPVLTELAENINMISQGLEHAIAGELRSERLKAELISNVSHDLKTPLTSIVTYVDLLKQEEINNDTAKDYIDVIDRKTQRLTVLTNDLFEAAKASSGDMPVNLEKVDLKAIIRQALGEFDEKLQTAALEVRTKLPEDPVYVKADGRLTWRVMDNLLSNVVKYALTGSRVYIDVKQDAEGVFLILKNISDHELNIPSDELMERFKRGDESRSSEGSGLGLSIANSLMDLQHGSFKIDIDGDLFKVTVGMRAFSE